MISIKFGMGNATGLHSKLTNFSLSQSVTIRRRTRELEAEETLAPPNRVLKTLMTIHD